MMDDEGRRRLPALILFMSGAILVLLAFTLVHEPRFFSKVVMYTALGCIFLGIVVGTIGVPLRWSRPSGWLLVCGLVVFGLCTKRMSLTHERDPKFEEFLKKSRASMVVSSPGVPDASVDVSE